ncbi:MAG: epoxyqueuosine reductase QueH [Bdellovibrionales bacterium]
MRSPQQLCPPNNARSILLHTCCAPCAGDVIETIKQSGLDLTVLYYNPNIHPRDEYELRKNENMRFADKLGIPFIDADYDPPVWFARVKGLECEPERGKRCEACFDLRMERTALYAHENGFSVFATSLGISRWKNLEQVNASGLRAAARYEDVTFWNQNWRKNGGTNRMVEVARREDFYRQDYCGCVFSQRESEERKKNRNLPE